MRIAKSGLGVLVFFSLAAAGHAAFERWKTSVLMTQSAHNFLVSLTPEQRAKAQLPFDDPNRVDWHFIPRLRKGLTFKEMNSAQARLGFAFLASGLSRRAYMQATTIMSLDEVLLAIEKGSGPVRDPELYYLTIFGDPTPLGRWGWRIEGHHVSVNFIVDKGEVTSTTPFFLGANPAEVLSGPRQGLRTLEGEEDLGRELMLALDATQKSKATILKEAPKDIVTFNNLKAEPGAPQGLPVSAMNAKEKEILNRLLELYITRSPEDLAESRRKEVRAGGIDKIYFGWAGSTERRQGHYYRLQGATFLIEYDCTQNDANHIHSVWRDLRGDFGPNLLAEHHAAYPHTASGQ